METIYMFFQNSYGWKSFLKQKSDFSKKSKNEKVARKSWYKKHKKISSTTVPGGNQVDGLPPASGIDWCHLKIVQYRNGVPFDFVKISFSWKVWFCFENFKMDHRHYIFGLSMRRSFLINRKFVIWDFLNIFCFSHFSKKSSQIMYFFQT